MNPFDFNHSFEALEKLPTFEDIRLSIAASPKARHDRLMTMRSEMPPHKYYQGTTCTEPYGQTTRDELVDDFNNLIIQNRWREELERLLESEMPPLPSEFCERTYNVPYDQTTMDKLVDDDLDKKSLRTLSLDWSGMLVETSFSTARHYFRMFQNIDSKTLLPPIQNKCRSFELGLVQNCDTLYGSEVVLRNNIINRVRQQSFASDRSIRRKIKDTIDSVLAIDKQKIVSLGPWVLPMKRGVSDKPNIIRLEDELDWLMIMHTEMPLYDSDEAPTYGPHGQTMRVKLVDYPDNNRLQVSWKEIVKELMNSTRDRLQLIADLENRLQVSWKEIVKELMNIRRDRHQLIAHLENRLPARKEEVKELTITMDKLIADRENNRLEELRRETLNRKMTRLNRLSEMLTTRDKLTTDPEKNRLAASRKERHDKLMIMPSEMRPHKYYQGTMCTEPYGQTMRDTHVPYFDYHIFQNRWKEALDRQLESEMPPYELCGQTYNVPFEQTTMDKLVDDLHNNSRVHQPSCVLPIVGTGGVGKTTLASHLRLYFDSDTIFQNTHNKTLLGGIFNRVRQQSLNSSFSSDQSFRMNIKDTIDFMLGIDKQETILRKKGIDMDILWCIVDALAEECNCDVDPVLTACQLLKSAPARFGGKAAGDLSKTAVKKERHRLRRIRRMGRRVVPRRRCLAQNRKTRGVVSRSDPIAADNSSLKPEQTWHVASAAPQHMTGYLNHLVDYTPAYGDQVIDTPNMGPMAVHGCGSVNIASMILGDVLFVPGLEANLVSTGQLAELGYTIAIGPYGCRVYKDDGGMNLVGKAHYIDGYLLELDFLMVSSTN